MRWDSEIDYPAEDAPKTVAPKSSWWCWLLILPAAVLGWIVAQIAALLPGIFLPDQAAQIVSSFMPPMGFVIFGTWVIPNKRTQVAGALAVIMLVLHGMFWGVILFSGRYEISEIAFNSTAAVVGIIGSLLGFYLAYISQGIAIRQKIGVALLSVLAVTSNAVVPVVIFLGIVTGIWWPIIQAIIESPAWALLLIPLGLLFSGFAWWIQTFIYNLLVFPLAALTGWLLQEKVVPTTSRYTAMPSPTAIDATAYYNRGLTYYDIGQYEEAIADYNMAIELDPQSYYPYYNRGLAYYDIGQYEEAIEDYNMAIELDPQYTNAYTARGLAYYNLDQHEEAIEDYNMAIELDPQYTNAYYNRGLAYSKLGQHELADKDFQKARDLGFESQ